MPLSISALTSVNALGAGVAATRAAVLAERSGLRRNDFTVDPLATWIGRVEGVEDRPIEGALAAFDCRNNRLAGWALATDDFAPAVAAARARHGANRIGVFIGTSTSGILTTELSYRRRATADSPLDATVRMRHQQNVFSVADFVRQVLALEGPTVAVSTACSSSLKVFAQAARAIAAGWCDAAVVGGADSLCFTTLYGFNSLQLLSTEPCRPCSADRTGISVGEGAAFALLERRAPKAGEFGLYGYGESSDAHHMSSPDPDGAGAERAMRAALVSSSLDGVAIDYIAMHGTGTPANDGVEDMAIHRVFGATVRTSSTKGWTGHTLGAAGIMNVLITLTAIDGGVVPGTLNTTVIDARLKAQVIGRNVAAPIARAIVNAFGFGGNNASIVVGRA